MTIDPTTSPAEDLLQALAVGDLRPDAPDVAARLRAEPDLHARWLELAATVAELQRLASPAPSSELAVEPTSAAMGAVRAYRASTAPTHRWRLGMLIAAAVVWMVVWSLAPSPPVPSPDPHLGGGQVGAMAPNGAWRDGEPFSWPAVRGAVGYRLQVRASSDGAVRTLPDPAAGDDVFSAPSWRPSAAERRQLPARFEWRALAFDGSGQQVGSSAWATAQH